MDGFQHPGTPYFNFLFSLFQPLRLLQILLLPPTRTRWGQLLVPFSDLLLSQLDLIKTGTGSLRDAFVENQGNQRRKQWLVKVDFMDPRLLLVSVLHPKHLRLIGNVCGMNE